ncbi:hypothetical protein EST38_g4396 [Candolleomyces aberdarensis]|uniref:Uncharacterized protein n=1 Tax=Candolleomyces aberdarensis TaxID=2316362 RepID=A0A4Q2DN34_9AGAR|nr:hypothetical protein EST38_g4396 [Candolleomyces aberdarensis]
MVFEVQVDRPQPVSFDLLGSLPIDKNSSDAYPGPLKIKGNRVLVPFGGQIVVWDFVYGRYHTFKIQDSDSEVRLSDVQFIGDFVLGFLSGTHICVCQLPEPVDSSMWHPAPLRIAEAISLQRPGLDKPGTTIVPLGLSMDHQLTTDSHRLSLSFPALWGGNFQMFPFIFHVVRTEAGYTVDSVSRYRIEVFPADGTEEAGPNVTLNHIATFTFGRHKILAFPYQTYAFDDSTPIPPNLGMVTGPDDDTSKRVEIIYGVSPPDSVNLDTPFELVDSTLSLDGDFTVEPEVRLTKFHKPLLSSQEVKCLCSASGRTILHGTYGRYYFVSVNDFFC